MKKLGLIGGIGPESTLIYYRKLVYAAQQRVGEHFFPNLTIESLNVFVVLELCRKQDYAALVDYLMTGIHNLMAAGAEVIALTGNTPHIVFDQLQDLTAVPLVSIVGATCEEAKRRQLSSLGLLGTGFTMQSDFFKQPLRNAGIKVVTPDPIAMQVIAEKITTELELGIVRPETQAQFRLVVQQMEQEQGIEAVILGCTELPLVFAEMACPVAQLDTLHIHVDKLLSCMLAE